MTDATKVLQAGDSLTIKKLLRTHAVSEPIAEDGFNVLLGAVVMHASTLDAITQESSTAAARKVAESKKFRRAKLLVVQQETVELVIDFIRAGLEN